MSSPRATDEGPALRIGSLETSGLVVRPLGRSHPGHTDYWDGNWIVSTIDVCARNFRGHVAADLRAEDFPAFRDALRALVDDLAGHATFDTMEHWIEILVTGDGHGHFEAKCDVLDAPSRGNSLQFTLEFDQTDLPAMLRKLDAIIAAFPVLGRP